MVTGIVTHLWFDNQAKQAAAFYASIFPDSAIEYTTVIPDTPSGDCDLVGFRIANQQFMALSAGPLFKLNPSISFFLNFDSSQDKKARANLDATWKKLAAGGIVRMPLDKYPFSERFGWIEDKYGVNWQLILSDPKGDPRPFIVPSLMFTQQKAGKAERAIRFYTSVFPDSRIGQMNKWPKGMAPEKEGTVMFADFQLAGQWFAAMDSAQKHDFAFNEGISLVVNCDSQTEMDQLSDKLSAVHASEQCGWLKDKFGVSWQIQPSEMEDMMHDATNEQMQRVVATLLPMKRLDAAKLRKAYEGAATKKAARRPAKKSATPRTKKTQRARPTTRVSAR